MDVYIKTNEKKKILFQINECLNFSTGRIAQQIGETAINRGWESWIAYSVRQPFIQSQSHIVSVGRKIEPYIHYAENRLFDREGLSSRRATRELVEKIKCLNPDVVQLHNLHDHWLNYQILFEYLNNTDIKIVWTFHDCWAITGGCMHFVTSNCCKWKSGCGRCPQKKNLVDRSSNNWELKKHLFASSPNLTVVTVSDWLRSYVQQSFLKDKRVVTIHNGIDLEVFKPRFQERKKKSFEILAVSNVWNKDKGIDDIFEIRKQLPLDYGITIVGLNKKQKNNIPEGITGIERTESVDELVRLYSSSDVLINPTYADSFPTVNIESIACGTPVITYKTGGSPEIIDDNTGIVVEQGNISEMVKAIIALKEHPLKREACRQRALSNFDRDKRYADYLSLYNKLCDF